MAESPQTPAGALLPGAPRRGASLAEVVAWAGAFSAAVGEIHRRLQALPRLAHGVYTPVRSAEANLDANVTPSEAQWLRVGNVVVVSGRFTANPTLTATATSFELSLPVFSNLGAAEDLAGVAFCGAIAGQGAEVVGSVANNTAVVQWVAGDVTNQTWGYVYSYYTL